MNIINELNAAAAEAADLLWRKWLVESWRRYPNASMGLSVAKFVARYGALAGIPDSMPDDNPREMRMHITRYLACFYRPVSDALFDGATDEQAVRMLGRAKKSTSRIELDKIRGESKEKRESDQMLMSVHITSRAAEDKFAAHRRSEQWGVCK